MKLFDEIMRRLGADEELVFNGVKYVVFDGRCGYFENVKGIGDFSGEAVEILLKKGKLLVSGKNLYIRLLCRRRPRRVRADRKRREGGMKALTMFDRYEITSLTVNRAVNKLARAGIEVFNVRKTGKTRIRLSIRAKDSEKFFAIFHGSCYTINKLKDRGLKRLAVWALCRVGVLVGIALFCLTVFLSGALVFKVEVVGSGSHYREEVCALLSRAGLSPFSPYSEERAQNARAGHSSICPPSVSARCRKRAASSSSAWKSTPKRPQKFPRARWKPPFPGKILQLVCIRGTPLYKEGDTVEKGATLVAGYVDYGEGGTVRREVAAIAKAVLECEISYEYESKEESDKALADAYAAATLEIGDAEILEKSADVRAENGAFVYEIHIRYAATFAVNMD